MAQHKQMAITQFKHKYQQIHLEHTYKTEHHTPSSIIQIFTNISSYHIIKTTQFLVEETETEKRYLRFCLPELQLEMTVEEEVVWFLWGLGFGFKLGGTVVLLCISLTLSTVTKKR